MKFITALMFPTIFVFTLCISVCASALDVIVTTPSGNKITAQYVSSKMGYQYGSTNYSSSGFGILYLTTDTGKTWRVPTDSFQDAFFLQEKLSSYKAIFLYVEQNEFAVNWEIE